MDFIVKIISLFGFTLGILLLIYSFFFYKKDEQPIEITEELENNENIEE